MSRSPVPDPAARGRAADVRGPAKSTCTGTSRASWTAEMRSDFVAEAEIVVYTGRATAGAAARRRCPPRAACRCPAGSRPTRPFGQPGWPAAARRADRALGLRALGGAQPGSFPPDWYPDPGAQGPPALWRHTPGPATSPISGPPRSPKGSPFSRNLGAARPPLLESLDAHRARPRPRALVICTSPYSTTSTRVAPRGPRKF